MNNTENKELMTVNKSDLASADMMKLFTDVNDNFYCSMKDDGTRKSKVKIYNAINNTEKSLNDMIGKRLDIIDVVAYPVELVDDETGEIVKTVRTVLIDKKGTGYSAVSAGVTNSLNKIFGIIGTPENGAWHDEPVAMEVKQIKTRNGQNKVNTLWLIEE